MANGHIPGRVNPYAQIGQTLAERQQQGLQAIQQILSGQLPQIPGMPGGAWTPDLRTSQQLMSAALEALQRDPTIDLSAFEQSFVQPLLSGSQPAQLAALDYYTRKATATGNLGAFPFTQLPGGSARAIAAQAQALSELGEQFHFDPRYQQMLGQFVSSLVPGGQTTTLPTSLLSAVAAPYFQQLWQYGGDATAAGLPQINFPTSTANMPLPRQQVIENIAQMALSTMGQEITPTGLQPMQARTYFQQLLQNALDALSGMVGLPPGLPRSVDAGALMGVPGAAQAQAPTVDTGTPQASSAAQDGSRSPAAAVQAIKNQLLQTGTPAASAIASLVANRNQLIPFIGEEGWRDLMAWAQINLPHTPAQAPPGWIDPIQAAINVLGR